MRVYGLSENDMKLQRIENTERSLLLHILNNSPRKKRKELEKKIDKLKAEIAKIAKSETLIK